MKPFAGVLRVPWAQALLAVVVLRGDLALAQTEPTLAIDVAPLHASGAAVETGTPLILTFRIGTAAARNGAIPLLRVEYALGVRQARCFRRRVLPTGYQLPDEALGTLECPAECTEHFFSDSFDLYGRSGPGSVKIYPPVTLPVGANQAWVCASLYYGEPAAPRIVAATVELPAQEPPQVRYMEYRDSLLRRHISRDGRLLSWLWLKEYEPGTDPKDLLFNSRTMYPPVASRSAPKIYVPWINGRNGSLFEDPGATRETDHPDYKGALLYGNENPLLRGGLAMATLSLEYLRFYDRESLMGAAQLFEYVKKSEWLDDRGEPSGFFLRAAWPGDSSTARTRPLYASADEILGMTLGLRLFRQALSAAPSSAWTRGRSIEVERLTDRLAKQLKGNYYFIVPPQNMPSRQRQKGWDGLYPFEWFLVRAFKAITSHDYSVSTPIRVTDTAWRDMARLPWRGEPEDETRVQDTLMLGMQASPSQRALFAIKGIGALSNWSAGRGEITLRLDADIVVLGLLRWADTTSDAVEVVDHSVLAFFPLTPIPAVWEVIVRIMFPFTLDFWHENPWTYAMLLHAYALGIEGSGDADRQAIGAAMSTVLTAFLTNTTRHVSVDFDTLKFLGVPLALIPTVVVPALVREVTLPVSARDRTPDYFTAALAAHHVLMEPFLVQQIPPFHRDWAELLWSAGPPLSDRFGNECPKDCECDPGDSSTLCVRIPDVNKWPMGRVVMDHNPLKALGSAFAYEKGPKNKGWMQGGGSGRTGSDGVYDVMIEALSVDSAREGAGLDWLFPTALMLTRPDYLGAADERRRLEPEFSARARMFEAPFVAGCVTNPRGADNCVYPWPPETPLQDSDEPNNVVDQAAALGCNIVKTSAVAQSTLYGRDGVTRRRSHQGEYTAEVTESPEAVSRLVFRENLWSTDDVDYFRVSCDTARALRVDVTGPLTTRYYRLVVDGTLAATRDIRTGAAVAQARITVPARAEHWIMVTGDAAQYSLTAVAQ